jgi:soluble lytic murein transglycosylase-like protein
MAVAFYMIPLGFLVTGFVMMNKEPDVLIERVKVEVPKGEENTDDLIDEIPSKYGVSKLVVQSIIKKESNGDPKAIRFESHHMERARKFSKNPDQQRMYASSIGLMQVMAWHMPPLGLSWTDLIDKRTNMEVGTKILRNCLDRHKDKNKYQQYYGALTCYNGSEKYAQEVMNEIGKALINEVL